MAEPTLEDRIGALACPVDHTMLDPAIQDDPWDFYTELHEQCPVFPMPEIGAVMVTRYDDVRFVLTNPELFSSSGRGGGTKKGLQVDNARRYQEILRARGWGHVETLQRTDPPVHSDYRRLVAKAFLPSRIAAMADHTPANVVSAARNSVATPTPRSPLGNHVSIMAGTTVCGFSSTPPCARNTAAANTVAP